MIALHPKSGLGVSISIDRRRRRPSRTPSSSSSPSRDSSFPATPPPPSSDEERSSPRTKGSNTCVQYSDANDTLCSGIDRCSATDLASSYSRSDDSQ
jgi:hypothetical protein